MTVLYMDGFDHYGSRIPGGVGTLDNAVGTRNMLNGNWAQISGSSVPNGSGFVVSVPSWAPTARTGPYCLTLNQVSDMLARKVLPAPQSKLFVSFGFGVDRLISVPSAVFIIDFRDNIGDILYSLGMSPDGNVQLWAGNQDTLVATSAGPVIQAQTWQFYEMCLDFDTGAFTLRVDDATGTGTPVLTASVVPGNIVTSIGFGQYGASFPNGQSLAWDDLLIRNADGTVNNGWMGDRRVATLFPNADTDEDAWTPSYYKEFGNGILRLSYQVPNRNDYQAPEAYLSCAASTSLDIANQDFTWESMVRFDRLPAANEYQTIFARWNNQTSQRSYRFILGGTTYNNGCFQLDTTTDGTNGTLSTPIIYPFVPETDQWYHIALCRSAGELLLFVNGQQLGLPIADSTTWFSPSTAAYICGQENNGGFNTQVIPGSNFCGRLDETRFTNGVSRYTGPFAPPTTAFPRGSTDDPDWADVVLLSSYDSAIIDESSYARTITAANGASMQIPIDGPIVGLYSTVNKPNPDDNTFISAALTPATNILTMTTQPSNGNTVTVGTTDGATPAVYTFVTTVAVAYDVLIDTTAQATLINLYNAINAGSGAGTKYGTGTLANYDVMANQLPVGQIQAVALVSGTAGNSIASTETGSAAAWDTATLTGGLDIPGPTAFTFQRPPNNTTIITALQTVIRANKSDSGLGTVQTAFIAPLGAVQDGDAHPLSLSTSYYNDIIETDPDTDGPLSPTAIINGQFQITRTE